MLYAFVQKQKESKSTSQLNITYIVGGRSSVDGEIVRLESDQKVVRIIFKNNS